MSRIFGDEWILGKADRWQNAMSESDLLDKREYLVGVMCDDGSLIWQLCEWTQRHTHDGRTVPGVFIAENRWVELRHATLCRLLPRGYVRDGKLFWEPEVDNEQ